MNLKISFTLLMLAVLQGCSLAPKQTLQPEHVPALYTPPSVQTPASVGTTAPAPDRAMEQAGSESAVLTAEQAATDEQPAPIELASLSPDMAVTATDTGSTIATATEANADNCALISAEIAQIDAGLGAPAVETPPATPPTIAQKTGRYFYDLGAQTVLGQLQVFIQTKRAIFNDNEKERRAAEALERGTTRRAYLMGYASAANCQVASQ